MGLFDKLFKKETPAAPPAEGKLFAPLEGQVVSVKEVSDPTFSEEILGKGVAIRPTGNTVVAPCDGTVSMMFDTGHAVTLVGPLGAEILIHVGLETVQLKGQHFTVHASNGDTVKAGQPLITFDREAIAAAGYDTITPMVICNSGDYSSVEVNLAGGDAPIITLKK